MPTVDLDYQVRTRTFEFLNVQVELHGEVLPRGLLAEGIVYEGARVPLLGPQGIWKPRILDFPLSITTVPIVGDRPRPYDDGFDRGGLLRYRYRGEDRNHPDNVGLREVMRRRFPLVYFYGVTPGRYMPCWPAFVEHDNPTDLFFAVALDDQGILSRDIAVGEMGDSSARRSYITTLVRRRMHQQTFRERVLQAYREHCAVCRLKHHELLEAAHILPDSNPRGEPIVSNGLALCSLHHAAFDRNILGIRPDLTIEIRKDILEEIDGPMLVHGLQGFQSKQIMIPRTIIHHPNPDFLAERFEIFRKAS